MAQYWEKRPVFEAVQLKPENLEPIKEMTGSDVAFSDKWCYLSIYDRLCTENLDMWLIRKPNGQLIISGNHDFMEKFESTTPTRQGPNIFVQNNPTPPRGE